MYAPPPNNEFEAILLHKWQPEPYDEFEALLGEFQRRFGKNPMLVLDEKTLDDGGL